MLKPLGFEMVEADNSETALAEARRLKPDLVLMDVRMPVMDGLEATRRIRALQALKHIVIIAISASVFGRDRDRCIEAGADEFLPKPFARDELLDVIARRLSVEWIAADRAEDQHATAEQCASHQAMIVPPDEVLEALRELTLRGDIKQILKEVDRLAQLDPGYEPFASELRGLAKAFQLATIDQLLNGARQHA